MSTLYAYWLTLLEFFQNFSDANIFPRIIYPLITPQTIGSVSIFKVFLLDKRLGIIFFPSL